MEAKISNTYTITFRDLKDKFPEIKGDLVEMSLNEKSQSLIIDTTSAYYEDSKVVIHKEVVSILKDVYRIRDKGTNMVAEGSTEQEAKDRLAEIFKQSEGKQDGKKPRTGQQQTK